MSKTDYPGIDYGMGKANVDTDNGVRYGIISQNSVSCYAMDDVFTQGDDLGYQEFVEEVKGDLRRAIQRVIEDAGGSIDDDLDVDDMFDKSQFDFYESTGPYLYTETLDLGELVVQTTGDNDLFVFKSPFYTKAQFCSPCVPGAGNLDCHCPDGPRTYCLPQDWFDEERPCPYPIYRMDNDECVYSH